jgi:hypothetical protein
MLERKIAKVFQILEIYFSLPKLEILIQIPM